MSAMLLRTNVFWRLIPVIAALLAAPVSAGASGAAGDVGLELRSLYRTQTQDGAFVFEGTNHFYAAHPVMASMCLDAHHTRPDAALVSQTARQVARYYRYLFATHDRDRDLLVETTARGVETEDIGFNALLSLDMMSLARVELEVRRPYDALFWYQGARAVQAAVVAAGFDADAGFFFPTRADGGMSAGTYYPLSAAPILFPGMVGDNHAAAMIREYVLKPVARAPESPYNALGGATTAWAGDGPESSRLLECIVLLRILHNRGFDADFDTFRAQAVERGVNELAELPDGVVPSPHHRHFIDLLEAGDAGALDDPAVALDLFVAIMRGAGDLEDNEILRMESNAATVKRLANAGEFGETDANAAVRAVRELYMVISKARAQMKDDTLLPSAAYRASGGVDPGPAMERLFDDAAAILQRVDNGVFRHRFRDAGLHVTPTLLRDRTATGAAVDVKWTIGAHNAPVTIHAATITVGDESTELATSERPLALEAGVERTLTSRFVIDDDLAGSLVPVTLTLSVDTGDEDIPRVCFHALRSVYVEHAVVVATAFRKGRRIRGGTLPIDVMITRNADTPVVVGYQWYSPTGLQLAEGRSGEYAMAADQDSVVLPLNIRIPSPCRPGRFPVNLKFTANGDDLGIVTSSVFKPYQWIFVGPLASNARPMETSYPPERAVRVLDTLDGASGPVRWRVLGGDVYDDNGDITFRRLLPKRSVGFLYTVVESGYETSLPVFMSSNARAELFVDGTSVLKADGGAPAYTRVKLMRGTTAFLIKVAGDRTSTLSFHLGDENDEASYAFNNDLSELVDGYATLAARARGDDDTSSETQKLVTLRYSAPNATAVSVIGTFNGWSPDRSPMHAVGDNTWEIVLTLPPGRYSYRFLVNGREQVLDPSNATVEADGFGGENSVIVVE